LSSWTQADLDALEQAIATGATRVSYDGKSIDYGSLDRMLRVRDLIRRELGVDRGPRTTLARFTR
jgi:hypothetical protein